MIRFWVGGDRKKEKPIKGKSHSYNNNIIKREKGEEEEDET